MKNELLKLRQRRGELLAKIAVQRDEFAELGGYLKIPLDVADRGIMAVRYMRSRPLLVSGALALVVVYRHGLSGLWKRGWRMWRGYRFITSMTSKYLQIF